MFGECHAHIVMDGKNYKEAVGLHKNGVREDVIRERLQIWKDSGVTFIRDGGDALQVSRRAKDLAPEYGIDYRTPVFAIHKSGHYGGIVGHGFFDGKDYRRLVRRAKEEGADFIKIMIGGLLDFSVYGRLTEEGLSKEEIQEMITFAHQEGMAVMAHGNGDKPVQAAVEAGVDSLEHGNYLEEETLQMLAESSVVWVPTFAPIGNLLGCGRFPDEEVKKILERQERSVRYAYERGANIGLGSDGGAYLVPHGQGLADEYGYMKEALSGISEEEIEKRLRDSEARIQSRMKRTD